MEKKYQIFISSTYLDLKDERQAVSKAVLDLGHIPSGMELFPASNASQIDYIKKVIDDCDYYVVIVGGRYGSLGADGISFTEQEFMYAKEKGIPILAFLHENVGELKSKNTESEKALIERLAAFRDKLQAGRVTKYWKETSDLQSSVITSLASELRDHPQTGWRRDNGEISAKALKEISELKSRADYWYSSHEKASAKVKSYEDLAQSEVSVRFIGEEGPTSTNFTGEEIIREYAAPLSKGMTRSDMTARLASLIRHTRDSGFQKLDDTSSFNVELFLEVFEIIESLGDKDDMIKIRDDKKYLLKAAFKPLTKVIDDQLGDEIPF